MSWTAGRHPLERELHLLARSEQQGWPRKKSRTNAEENPRAGARVGAHVAPGPPGEEQGADQPPTKICRRGNRARRDGWRIIIPRRRASATSWSQAETLGKAYGDRLFIDGLNFNLPRGGIVGVIGPNGAGKTTLFRMIRPGEARQRRAARRRVGEPVLRGSEPGFPRSRQERVEEIFGRPRAASSAPGRLPRARTSPRSTSRAPISKARGRPLGRRAEPPPPRGDAQERGRSPAPRRAHQ